MKHRIVVFIFLISVFGVCGLAGAQDADADAPGVVKGLLLDPSGEGISGASATLTFDKRGQAQKVVVVTGADGRFVIGGVSQGRFHLVASAQGFVATAMDGNVTAGQTYEMAAITLPIAGGSTSVLVTQTEHEIAAEQIRVEETQRLFGAIPNFYVSYVPNAAAMSTGQKYALAGKELIDPSSFVITGIIAGIQQQEHIHKAYGQGAEGFGKRYGAAYADFTVGSGLTNAVLPALLKQDPRYFYKGTGTLRARALYAIANTFVCKGDNHRWQPNYSNLVGSVAAGAVSNLYYPATDRNGAALTFENAGIGIAAQAGANLIQEFLLKKVTTKHRGS